MEVLIVLEKVRTLRDPITMKIDVIVLKMEKKRLMRNWIKRGKQSEKLVAYPVYVMAFCTKDL